MKTIWLVNPYGPIEGENWREYSFNQFGKYLSQNGYYVIWWTASFSHHFKKQRANSLKDINVNERFIIRLVPTPSYKKNFGFGRMYKDYIFGKRAMKVFLTEGKPDLIIAAENPLTMGKPSYTYAQRQGVPMIYDQMDIWPEFISRSLPHSLAGIANFLFVPVYRKRREIYDHLAGAIALGKHYLEFMQKVSPSLKDKPYALVYNGIDVEEFRSHLSENTRVKKISDLIDKKNEKDIWCIFAGTLGPSYDIKGIIECAKTFAKKENTNFKFIIAGSGPYEDEVKRAEKIVDNLIYIGKLLPEDLIPIYGKCDIGLATYSAGSNVDMCDKFYDYTAAGLAIVNSLDGEISEHISKEELGMNYKAGDSVSLEKALETLSDMKKINICKENSWKSGISYDKNRQNEKLLKVIETII